MKESGYLFKPELDDPMPPENSYLVLLISNVPLQPSCIHQLKKVPNPTKANAWLAHGYSEIARILFHSKIGITKSSPNMCMQMYYPLQASHMKISPLPQHRNPWTWNWQFLHRT